jgi:hypothetical protein
MARYRTTRRNGYQPAGMRVDVITLTGTGRGEDGQWIRVTHPNGILAGMTRTVAGLAGPGGAFGHAKRLHNRSHKQMTVHATRTATTRRVHCRGCNREATTPNPAGGHPYGWYTLSVNVPPEVGSNGRPYIYIGLFCSVSCLVGHERTLNEDAELTAGLYERE